MKRLLVLLPLTMLVMSACGAPEPTAIADPEKINALQLALAALLTTVFTAGFVYIFEKTGLDLRGLALPAATAVSLFVVGIVLDWINILDPMYNATIDTVLTILLIILAQVGVLRIASRRPATLLPSNTG